MDLQENSVYEVDQGLVLSDFTERHHVNSLPVSPTSIAPDSQPQADGVIFRLNSGLPSREEMKLTGTYLRRGCRVYYYWPEEDAIEVVTKERASSFRRHRLFNSLYHRASNLRNKQIAKSQSRDSLAAIQEPWGFLRPSDQGYQVEGRGMYIRLDYWAQLTAGGSYGHTCYQAKALDTACSEGLICVTASEFPLLRAQGLHQIVLPSRTELSDEYSLVENGKAYGRLIEELITLYRPRFVFERLVLGNRAAANACKKLGIPYIAETNGSELTMSKIFGGREMANAETLQAIETASFEAADVVSTVSDPVSDMVHQLGIDTNKVLTNPNGVDLQAYGPLTGAERIDLRSSLGLSEQEVVLGFCGTFGGWHGIEVLAEAIPKVCAAAPNVRFLLIGDGGFKHLVQTEIERAGLQDRVIDLGLVAQTEAATYLAACDVLLSPHSKNMGDQPFFGSPTKLFEYMAYGVGIICSDLVQLGEVMRPALRLTDRDSQNLKICSERSVLVEPASVEALVEACLWLAADPQLCKHLGANARKAAQEYYSWDQHVQTLFRFLRGDELRGYHEDRKNL